MPRINTSIDDLVLQSDHAFEFPTEPGSLTVDPMFVSDDSEITNLRGENLEKQQKDFRSLSQSKKIYKLRGSEF
ncbi:hypothetical protein R6Q57_001794 [Mikania cordata]